MGSSLPPKFVVGALLILLAVGCSGDEDLGGRLPLDRIWRIGNDPTLVIGALDSTPEESLYQVQGVAILSDGRLAVADGGFGRSRVSVFSPEGHHLRTLGRPGDGPGEFRWVTSLQAGPNDSLYAFDPAWQRLTVFSPDGSLARTVNSQIPVRVVGSDGLYSVARLSDGVWAGRGMESVIAAVAPGEIRRDTIAVGLLDGNLDGFRPLEYLAGSMTTRIADGRFGGPPFSPNALTATWGRCVFMTTAETPSIAIYSSAGQLLTRFDGPGKPRPVSQEHLDSLLDLRLQTAPEEAKPMIRRWIREAARPAQLPYYNQMVVDEWGQLWLQEYEIPTGSGSLWHVVAQSGEHIGTVTLPKRIRIFGISRDGVLVTRQGEFDETRLELLPLANSPAEMAPPLPQCGAPIEPKR